MKDANESTQLSTILIFALTKQKCLGILFRLVKSNLLGSSSSKAKNNCVDQFIPDLHDFVFCFGFGQNQNQTKPFFAFAMVF